MDLIAFDIMKEHVSVHQPVARVLACQSDELIASFRV